MSRASWRINLRISTTSAFSFSSHATSAAASASSPSAEMCAARDSERKASCCEAVKIDEATARSNLSLRRCSSSKSLTGGGPRYGIADGGGACVTTAGDGIGVTSNAPSLGESFDAPPLVPPFEPPKSPPRPMALANEVAAVTSGEAGGSSVMTEGVCARGVAGVRGVRRGV
eukprot:scaffold78828_cov23-Tisochrysis_lutea.AAC.2